MKCFASLVYDVAISRKLSASLLPNDLSGAAIFIVVRALSHSSR